MANGNPEITGESATGEGSAEANHTETILADYRRATGQANH